MENLSYTKREFPTLEQVSDSLTIRLKNVLDNEISFNEDYKNYCICIVDIVNSSKITAPLPKDKVCKYYGIFLNSMAIIAKEFGGIVVKNIGDSLLYYFPQTSDYSNKHTFIDSLECSMTMIDAHDFINQKMREERLPPVNYRISADYGSVVTAKTITSSSEDVFGATVNMCAKINHIAQPNSMVIGGDLFEIVKSFDTYQFEAVAVYSSGFKLHYPIYSVRYHKLRRLV